MYVLQMDKFVIGKAFVELGAGPKDIESTRWRVPMCDFVACDDPRDGKWHGPGSRAEIYDALCNCRSKYLPEMEYLYCRYSLCELALLPPKCPKTSADTWHRYRYRLP